MTFTGDTWWLYVIALHKYYFLSANTQLTYLTLWRITNQMKNNREKEIEGLHQKKPDNWKAGVFYSNPDDARIIVPKRNPTLGWTLNFSNKRTIWALVAIVVIVLVYSLLF